MNTELQVAPTATRGRVVAPQKLAHVVMRTSRYPEMVRWYKTVLSARGVFENEILSFLTYDDEHHRIAIVNAPSLSEQPAGICGVHHIAFTYPSLKDLMSNYEVLRDLSIKPVYVINHGPTTSLYYADPDGNQLELQVENFESVQAASEFFYTPAFAENPIGVEFDPEDLVRRLRAGEPEETLKRRPDVGKRGLADIKLR